MKKKNVILVIVVLFWAANVKAQFRIGGKAGISSVAVAEDKMNDYLNDNVIGFYIGPTVEYLFNGKLGLDISVLYSEKGLKLKDEKTHRLGYIEIPVNVKYVYPLNDKIKVYGSGGPYISFKIAGSKNFAVMNNDLKETWEAKPLDMGLNFSGGVEVFNFLQLGISYGLGFIDNYKLPDGRSMFKNRVWSFSASAYF